MTTQFNYHGNHSSSSLLTTLGDVWGRPSQISQQLFSCQRREEGCNEGVRVPSNPRTRAGHFILKGLCLGFLVMSRIREDRKCLLLETIDLSSFIFLLIHVSAVSQLAETQRCNHSDREAVVASDREARAFDSQSLV